MFFAACSLFAGQTVALQPPPCAIEWVDLAKAEELLRMEIASSTAAPAKTGTITVAATSCDPVACVLALELDGSALAIDLYSIPRASRPRAAALAIYERLRATASPPVEHAALPPIPPLPPLEQPRMK